MNEQKAFLATLWANPLDWTTRLVYADWLDEHGMKNAAIRQRNWARMIKSNTPIGGWLRDGKLPHKRFRWYNSRSKKVRRLFAYQSGTIVIN